MSSTTTDGASGSEPATAGAGAGSDPSGGEAAGSDGRPAGYRSIGEVLSLLQEDFPDVTISKIRFLESQGLIQPERTAAGYRKFYDADVERLRWILTQQRDHFLPLKVIRKMLADGVDRYGPGDGSQPTLWTPAPGAEGDATDTETDTVDRDDADDVAPAAGDPGPGGDAVAGVDAGDRDPGAPGPAGNGAGRPPRSRAHPAVASARRHETPADVVAALQEDPRPPGRPAAAGAVTTGTPPAATPSSADAPAAGGVDAAAGRAEAEPDLPEELSASATCERFGVDGAFLAELERYGLIDAVERGGEPCYGRDALRVVGLAVRAAASGAGPRHLRMYLVAAEREAGFIEQVVMPLLKQRNPAARERAGVVADDLADLGAALHRALLDRALRAELGR